VEAEDDVKSGVEASSANGYWKEGVDGRWAARRSGTCTFHGGRGKRCIVCSVDMPIL